MEGTDCVCQWGFARLPIIEELAKRVGLAPQGIADIEDNVDSVSVPDSLTAVVWFRQRAPDAFFKVARLAQAAAVIKQHGHAHGCIGAADLTDRVGLAVDAQLKVFKLEIRYRYLKTINKLLTFNRIKLYPMLLIKG